MIKNNILPKVFLFILLFAILYAVYRIFEPFLIEIIAATILVSIFYTPYEWLVKRLRGRRAVASFIMCIIIIAIVIVPLVNLIILGAQKSVEAYGQTIRFMEGKSIEDTIRINLLEQASVFGINAESVKSLVIDLAKKSSNVFASGAASLVKGTTNFIISLLIIIFTMFFFFIDGKKMVEKLMLWTPLPNKYDKEIFKKFRDVSFSTVISTFATATAQGVLGGLGFWLVSFWVAGFPAFLPGVFMAFLSLLPYVGTAFVWGPGAIYLLLTGHVGWGIALAVWGGAVVSNVDNVLRAYILKGKAQVNPIFLIFAILGGISIFGFWGIFLGPLVISIAITILHIYELEYETVLEK